MNTSLLNDTPKFITVVFNWEYSLFWAESNYFPPSLCTPLTPFSKFPLPAERQKFLVFLDIKGQSSQYMPPTVIRSQPTTGQFVIALIQR